VTLTIPKKTRGRNRKKTRGRNRKYPRCSRNKARERNRRLLQQRRRRLLDRIANRPGPESDQPMITAGNIHYELGERVAGLAAGGIGAMLLLAHKTGLIGAIDHQLHLLKRHVRIEPLGTRGQNA
jgi:hypothetical protein